MMMKGLVAGLVIVPVIIFNSRLIRKLHVNFSREWFSRRSYQRFFKGMDLVVLYLSGYWIINYFILVWSENPDLNYMSWFGYNCFFFIIAIPLLTAQKSKFVAPAIGFALFLSLSYPTLIHSVPRMKDESHKRGPAAWEPFKACILVSLSGGNSFSRRDHYTGDFSQEDIWEEPCNDTFFHIISASDGAVYTSFWIWSF